MSQNQTPVRKNTFSLPMGNQLSEMVTLCKVLFEAPYYKKMGVGGILAILLTARELGLPEMACLNGGLHVIEGKVSLSAQMMNLLIVNAGHFIEIVHSDENYCEIIFERSDRQGRNAKYTHKYTIEDARIAGYLGRKDPKSGMMVNVKDNWVKNPKDMLFARCISVGGKRWMPDVFMGSYVMGEIEVHAEEVQVRDYQEDTQNFPITEKITPVLESPKPVEPYEFTQEQLKYVDYAMSEAGWTKEKVRDWASNNPQKFEEKYNKWLELRTFELNEPPRED